MKRKIKYTALIALCILIYFSSCNDDKYLIDIKAIKEAEYKLTKLDDTTFENKFKYFGDTIRNRFVFDVKGNLKNYYFLTDQGHSTYSVEFNNLNNNDTLGILGDPYCYRFFDYNKEKSSVLIRGLVSRIISDSVGIVVVNILDNKKYIMEKLPFSTHYSKLIEHYTLVIPNYNFDSLRLEIRVNAYSSKFGNRFYVDTIKLFAVAGRPPLQVSKQSK